MKSRAFHIRIEIGAGVTGYKIWNHFKKKSGAWEKVEMIRFTTGTPSTDRNYGVLRNLFSALKLLVLDMKLSGVFPEFAELIIVTREEGVIKALKLGRCKSMIMETMLQEILEKAKQFKTFSVKLPTRKS